jgi:hypothetical protein
MTLYELVLAANFEPVSLEIVPDVLAERLFDDAFETLRKPVLCLELMGLPTPLMLARTRIDRPMLLEFELALFNIWRSHIELRCSRPNSRPHCHDSDQRDGKMLSDSNKLSCHLSPSGMPIIETLAATYAVH